MKYLRCKLIFFRAQFNLLTSLAKSIRPELRKSILDSSLTPAQVALLTPADLASAERLEEIQQARQTALQQTVKAREDVVAAVRLGRDGFERVEDQHEKELRMLAKQEEAARVKEQRRESMVSHDEGDQSMDSPSVTRQLEADDVNETSPIAVQPPFHKRSESLDTAAVISPSKALFALTSAWGGEKADSEALPLSYEGDQTTMDLSDIVVENDMEGSLHEDSEVVPAAPSEMKIFEAKPVVWTGGVGRLYYFSRSCAYLGALRSATPLLTLLLSRRFLRDSYPADRLSRHHLLTGRQCSPTTPSPSPDGSRRRTLSNTSPTAGSVRPRS